MSSNIKSGKEEMTIDEKEPEAMEIDEKETDSDETNTFEEEFDRESSLPKKRHLIVKKRTIGIGIKNIKATSCATSALMQILYHIVPFRKVCKC